MMKNFSIRLIVVQSIVVILLAAGWSVPGLAANGRDSVAVRNPQNAGATLKIPNARSEKADGVRSQIAQQKFLKIQKAIEKAKKISVQTEAIQKMEKSRGELQRRTAAKRMMRAQQNDRIFVLGKESNFRKAPPASVKRVSSRAMRVSLASPVLINGKQSDTLEVGQPYDVTFSFSPGFVSAVMNVYVDTDSNGVVSDGDIEIYENALLLDNDAFDADPAQGSYRLRLIDDYVLNHIAGTLIFQINDYQSVGTAIVTLRQPSSPTVIEGSIVPPLPNIIVELGYGGKYIFVCTDSSGKFNASIEANPPYYANAHFYDLQSVSNGYILPDGKSIVGIEDTTRVVIGLDAAPSFCEGYMRDYLGNPVKGGLVSASLSSSYNTSAECRTDSTGHYRIGLTGGTWVLYAYTPGSNEYMQGGYQTVLVPNAGDINVDISIPNADSTISGKITLNSSGLGGLTVYAAGSSTAGYQYYNSAMTRADGTYSIPVSNTGTYDVEIYLGSTGYYSDSQIKYSLAPGAENVDFKIHQVTGGISGKVTDSNTHKPISGALIEVQNYSSYNYYTQVTDDSGNYRFPLINGSYYFYAYAKGHYSYYDYVTVSGQMVTKDFSVQPSGMITGKVTTSNGTPVWSAYVNVYDTQYNLVGSNDVDEDGTYYIDGLNAGQYKAVATSDNYISKWYKDAGNLNSATLISVSAGTETSGIDFVLTKGGMVSGRVTDRTGKPVDSAQVIVYDSSFYWQSYAVTNDSGVYLTGGLETGNYYVSVSHPDFAGQWYDGKTNSADANKVSVTVGQRTSGIDFSLTRASKISGMVADKNGNAIYYASVYVLDTLWSYVAYTYTQQTGKYQVTGLSASTYYMFVSASGFGIRWYDNVSSSDSATAIHLSEGQEATNIDFTLLTGGTISGRVLDTKGNAIYSATVFASSVTGTDYGYTYTDYLGNYSMAGLSSTEYIVTAYASEYAQQWYDHEDSLENADTVLVQPESVTGNIDFNLASISGIYGTISSDLDGSVLSGMNVCAFDRNTRKIFYANSWSDGSYSLDLPEGDYTVAAYDPTVSRNYLPSFYSPTGPVAFPSEAGSMSIIASQARLQMDFRLKKTAFSSTLTRSNLKLSITNMGRLGTGDSTLPSCRWPSNSSRNYLFEGDLIVAAAHNGQSPYVFGHLYGDKTQGWWWDPVSNYENKTISSSPAGETAFTGAFPYYFFLPEFTVREDCFSINNTDYVILVYKIYYGGISQGTSYPLQDVYVGQFLDFDVSPYRDLVGRAVSDSLIFVYDSTNSGGVNIGARLLSGKLARIGWWKGPDDPMSDSTLFEALKSDTSTAIPTMAADERVLLSSGPYSLDVGDSLTFAIAIVAGNGPDALLSASRAAAAKYLDITPVRDRRDLDEPLPTKFALHQNYPNPFNPTTNIAFDLPSKAHVRLCVYNVLGQLVTTLIDEETSAGRHTVAWNAGTLASGIYFCRIQSKSFTRTMKMLLMK